MAWFPNNPQANQFISQSQTQILQNFQELDTWTRVDHSPIDGGANNGYHYKVTLPNNPTGAAYPAYVTLNSYVVFNALPLAPSPVTGIPEIMIDNGTEVYPVTAKSLIGSPPLLNEGFYYTPGGLLVKFGLAVFAAAALQTINFGINAAVPTFAAAPIVFIQGAEPGVPLVFSITATTDLQFTFICKSLNNADAPGTITWMALGLPTT